MTDKEKLIYENKSRIEAYRNSRINGGDLSIDANIILALCERIEQLDVELADKDELLKTYAKLPVFGLLARQILEKYET